MSQPATPLRPGSAAITWTGAGALTSLAALLLMFGVLMVGAGAGDYDREEGTIGIMMGVVSLVGWIVLVVVSGSILVRGATSRRGALGAAPALVSVAWLGVAAALMMGRIPLALAYFGPLSPI